MRSFVRTAVVLCSIAFTARGLRAQENPPAPVAEQSPAPAPSPAPVPNPTYQITGSAHSGKTPLPGVTITASNTLTGKKYSVATISDGTFVLTGLQRGRYVLRAEFMGFAVQTQEVVLNPENPSGKADLELILASRQPAETPQRSASTGEILAA